MEAYLDQNAGAGMGPNSKIQTSMNDDVEKNIMESTNPSSKRQFLSDSLKGPEFSAHNKPLLLAANTRDAPLCEPGERHYNENAVLEVTRVCHSKKGGTQSGIMEFLTVQEKKEGSKQDKPLARSLKSRGMQTTNKFQLHGNTRIKKPLNEKEEATTVVSTVIVAPTDTKREDFFKPASMKQKQKMAKETTMKFESLSKTERRDESYFELDLQMEARRASKENAQLCAGKPIHPFFSQQTSGQQELSDHRTNVNASSTPIASILEIEDLTPVPPFHVNQLPETTGCEAGSQIASSTLFERKKDQFAFEVGHSAKSNQELCMLLKRPFLRKSCQISRSFSQFGRELKPNELEGTILERLVMFMKDLEKDSKHEETGEEVQFASTTVGLEERLKLYHSDHAKGCSGGSLDFTLSCTEAGSTSRNLLWTDVYQPCLPEQVCGNRDSVKFLSAWLQSWQDRRGSLMGSSEGDMFKVCDENKGWSEEDSDCSEDSSLDNSLQNVLVLAGPVGCGKTAAIYACAKKFSEAMESHGLGKWSAEAIVAPFRKRNFSAKSNVISKNTFMIGAKKAEQADRKENCSIAASNSNSKHIGRKQSPWKDTHSDSGTEGLGKDGASRDNKDMTILLFEDVDSVFEDDRGFMAAVAQVAATAKRPIILTSNDKELCLPNNLNAHLLEFERPSTKDLISLAYLVCIAEGIVCSPQLLLHVVKICNHDARKLLNYLQFWCQGRCHARPLHTEFIIENGRVAKSEKESGTSPNVRLQESDSAEITTLFNLEAQHRLWPSYIYRSFPCEVTESVACRLNEIISVTQANYRADKEKKLVQEVVKKRVLLDKMKKRMRDSPSKVGVDYTWEWEEEDDADETVTAEKFRFSDSPVNILKRAKTMDQLQVSSRKIRRQLAIVMSDSDDDTPTGTHKEQHHQDECHLHAMHAPSSPVSARSTEDVSPISALSTCKTEEMTPFLSGLHVEVFTLNVGAKPDSTHTSFQNTSEPVYNLWSHFQNCGKDKNGLLLSTASKESLSLVLSISDLSDNLSACDIMSCLHINKQDVKKDAFMFSSREDPECCSQLRVCAQVAHKSFQVSIRDFSAGSINMEDISDAVLIEEMMLAINDPFTLGKLSTDEKLSHHAGFVRGQAGPSCQEQELIRSRKRFSLQNSLSTELPPRAQRIFLGASFYETVSFLAQMGRLKQDSLTLGPTRQSRTRGYQSQLCSYPRNLSENSISMLQSFGSFGRL